MKLLYSFLKPLYEDRIRPCLEALSKPVHRIPFDMLWYLFRPGIDVYVTSGDMVSVSVVRAIKYDLEQTEWQSSATPSYWEVDTWHLLTNGSRIARVKDTIRLRSYSGFRDVTTLAICPVSYWDATDNGARRERILQQNKVYVQALKAGNMLMNYDGPDLTTQRHVGYKQRL